MGRSGVTMAVGVVAFIAIDFVVDWLLQLIGYGPTAELTAKVEQSLDRMQSQIIDGDPAAVANYQRLRQQERNDATQEGKEQLRQQAEAIEQSGGLGLRREFQKLRELQSKLRARGADQDGFRPGGQVISGRAGHGWPAGGLPAACLRLAVAP